jgi:hypothetical protein
VHFEGDSKLDLHGRCEGRQEKSIEEEFWRWP